ncbi:uncharacterized protein LOC135461630 [Liolophura sinensis]|uniref:uncharacterized protein LOC135461630 n=1 Tax=Liolophura sinensis TaxID=3198878 RepID=UPI003159726C
MTSVNHTRTAAMKRLLGDLRELKESAISGISAIPLEDNLFEWHCNIICNDVPFHVILFIPEQYPFKPPSADFLPFGLTSPYGAYKTGTKGMNFCLSILSDYENYHNEWRDEQGFNWSPSYTIQTILINIASFLSQYNAGEKGTNRELLTDPKLKCEDCGHTTETPFPPLLEPVTTDSAGASTSSCSPPCLPAITCYVSRQRYDANSRPESTDDIYGFGLDYHGPNKRKFWSSPCEVLTLKAFKNMKEANYVRSSTNEEITHFLPLVINENQADCIQEEFENSLKTIFQDLSLHLRISKKPKIEEWVVDFLPNVMATTIEDFCGALEGSGTLLAGFFQLHRLFLWAVNTYPSLQDMIDQKIQAFLDDPLTRHKARCPYLEEWLMLLTVTSKFSWRNVSCVFLSEARRRNVLQLVQENHRLGDSSEDKSYLLENTFNMTNKEKRRLIVQVAFINVARPSGLSMEEIVQRLDNNLGFPSTEMEAEIRHALKMCRDVKTYSDWYMMLKLETPSEETIHRQLLDAVEYAIRTTGYHSKSRAKSNGWSRLIEKRKRQQKKAKKEAKELNRNVSVTCEFAPKHVWQALLEERTERLKKAISDVCPDFRDRSLKAACALEHVEAMDVDGSEQQDKNEGQGNGFLEDDRPNLRPELSLKRLRSFKEMRHSELFHGTVSVGRPRRIMSCLRF